MAKKNATTTAQGNKGAKAAKASVTPVKVTRVKPTDAPETKAAAPKASKYRGATTGMRVMEYQDHTLAINDRPDRRRTDEELRADWKREFPNAVDFTLEHVRGVRNLYNQGKHRKENTVPETPSMPYVLVDGKRVKQAYSRARRNEAASAQPATQPVVAVATQPIKVKVGKRGGKRNAA